MTLQELKEQQEKFRDFENQGIDSRTAELLIENAAVSYVRCRLDEVHLEKDSFDLNPHLSIKYFAKLISDEINSIGYEYSEADVMLLWLTWAVFEHKFLGK